MGNGPVAADELRLLIERIERLNEEKKGIAEDIKSVFGEAKLRGFCTKTMKRIIALRQLRPDQRREMEAMLDTYKAALGMLDGTPLGNWAVERLKREKPRKDDPENDPGAAGSAPEDDAASQDGEAADGADAEEQAAEPEISIDEARKMGADAARAGEDVTRNPFPFGDVRRAAWDEAWCQELGSDGMDIPAALRPAATRKPKGAGKPGNAGDPQDGPEQPDGSGAAGDAP